MSKGPIAWMAQNHVAANLLMLFFLIGGLLIGLQVKQEVFPEIDLEMISVTVPYPGAGPEEVEDGIILKVEENLSAIDGIKKIRSIAREGVGTVTVEVLEGEDVNQILQDVKVQVDQIMTFPEDAEEPLISEVSNRHAVLSVAVYGNISEKSLVERADKIRDDLLAFDEITQVEVSGVRPYEISVEIDEATLRRYSLTLEGVAETIRKASLDLPAGSIKAEGGEIALRTKERKYFGPEYADIVVVTQPDGTKIKLGDIAAVIDGFRETDTFATFDGQAAAMVNVFRVADQRPLTIAEIVHDYVNRQNHLLPAGVNLAIWFDYSEILKSRMQLLLKNAYLGLCLVLIILSLFLELRLAFWIALGIPISFLGALFLLPAENVSINMISLFAFIMALGIVVDDAIIVGENVYSHRRMGKPPLQAAVDGTIEVLGAVTFSVLTTIVAFLPLLFIQGMMGKFIRVIPLVVIPILVVSLIEAFCILPAHLNMVRQKVIRVTNIQQRFAQGLESFVHGPFRRLLEMATEYRYTTISICLGLLLLTTALYMAGIAKFRYMPAMESDVIVVTLKMPYGTPVEETRRYADRLLNNAKQVIDEYDSRREDGNSILRNIFAIVGGSALGEETAAAGGNFCEVVVYLKPSDERRISSTEFADRWRESTGGIPGAESLSFQSELIHFGANINIQVSHTDFSILEYAAEQIKEALSTYDGVTDISDTHDQGKRELRFYLKPEARTLGITELDLARQLRAAFYGAEALRFQRGRHEVKVMVRYPEQERNKPGMLENMRIRTSDGGEIPFFRTASFDQGWGYSAINRTDQKRVINVTASTTASASPEEILKELSGDLLPGLTREYPGLSYRLEGESEERADSIQSMKRGFALALFAIYALLAVLFKSYLQPFIVMSAIPFGIVGAVWGHLLLGYDISIMSLFGIVALVGVAVNDSLILIDFVNRAVRQETGLKEAVIQAGQRRFRPVVLTSLTTFFGLAPMMTETSLQARFLIPMAISLAFGILFTTGITLFLVPSLYLCLQDVTHHVLRPVWKIAQKTTFGGAGTLSE
ncbi:MAG: efflux RND transporter permease subunit [Deltaproteobacteria bacterium]|nr:efflux RND transporter permease subunit [Deltaproteobacteria bacterium]